MAKEKAKHRPKRRFYKRKGLWIFLMLCVVAGLVALREAKKRLEPYKQQAAEVDLSTIDKLEDPSIMLDRNGQEIGAIFVENRRRVPIEEIPQKLIDALIAQEDQRFFEHDGVDRIGVARAVYLNLKAGEVTQGASTITMQLARNAFDLKSEARALGQSGLERKIVEAFLALRIEETLQEQIAAEYPDPEERRMRMKRLVLQYYLNRIPFGSGYFGVRSASLGYFGKEPVALTIEECASLVACVKNPSEISPLRDLEMNRKARNHVLNRMLEEGMITDSEWFALSAKPVALNPKPLTRGKSQLYEIIDDIALEKLGLEAMSRGGFKIYTTIDRDVQRQAEESLRGHLSQIEAMPGYAHPAQAEFEREPGKVPQYLQGAALMIDSTTGDVLAHVGGRDYADSQYDFIELGRRPFGTAFLPVVYAAALEAGLHPCTAVEDDHMDARAVMVGGSEGILGEWGMEVPRPPVEGRMTSRRALANSKIAASVRLGREVGLEKVAEQARRFGLDVAESGLLNRMLLGFDSVSLRNAVLAYGAFAAKGQALTELRYIDRIENANEEVVYQAPPAAEGRFRQVCDEITAYQVHDMMREALESGNLREEAAQLDQPFHGAVKTGTTHTFADAWCMGYNGRVSLGVWVGFHQDANAIYPSAFARKVAFPVWAAIMNQANGMYPGEAFEAPRSLEPVRICSKSGLLATRYCYEPVDHPTLGKSYRYTGHTELLRPGRANLGLCDVHGEGGIGTNEVLERYGPKTADPAKQQHLAVSPIVPQTSGLVGEDPYNAELVSVEPVDEQISIFIHGPGLILDTPLLHSDDSDLRLRRPRKIEIETD